MKDLNFLRPISIKNKIRIGPKLDGGYVVYEPALNSSDTLVTYGVGWDIKFEVDYHETTGNDVHMFDHTMFGEKYVDRTICMKLLKRGKLYILTRYIKNNRNWAKNIRYLAENNVFFHNEGIANRTTEKCDTFKNHIEKHKIAGKNILLKIDIEGNEYPLFDKDFHDVLINVNQIIIEFHFLNNKLREIQKIVKGLREDYEIVHIHGNNSGSSFTLYREQGDIVFPNVIELTFVRKDHILPGDFTQEEPFFPVSDLDYPNTSAISDFERLIFE